MRGVFQPPLPCALIIKPSDSTMASEVFEVERVLAKRVDGGEYFIQWRGYDLNECIWEPRAHIYDTEKESDGITWVRNRGTGEIGILQTHLTVDSGDLSHEFYRVEKVLKKRRDYGMWMYQVKFHNFDNRYNRWLALEEMTQGLRNEITAIHETLPTSKRVRRSNPFART